MGVEDMTSGRDLLATIAQQCGVDERQFAGGEQQLPQLQLQQQQPSRDEDSMSDSFSSASAADRSGTSGGLAMKQIDYKMFNSFQKLDDEEMEKR